MRRALPPDVQKLLDLLEPQIKKAFMEAIARIQSAAQLRAVIEHIQSGNIQMAIEAMRLDRTFFAPLDRAISEAYWQGGVSALANLPRLKDPFPAAVSSSGSTDGTSERNDGSGNTSDH